MSNVTKLYNAISDIAKSLEKDGSADNDHDLNRIRRVCFLALTMEVLHYGRSDQLRPQPKDLQSYNYGVCGSWLRQYYTPDFSIPRDWRICHTWRERPTWAALVQQLFDWDDQHLYKQPFTRERWENLRYRLVTRHAFDEISCCLGADAARDWKASLGTYGCQFFWMLPKCSGTRFAVPTKRTQVIDGVRLRKNHTSWYSASHRDLATYACEADLGTWDWVDQGLWDWQGGEIVDHMPLRFFDNLEEFEFNRAQSSISKEVPKELTSVPEGIEALYEVEMIVGKRELIPRAIEYQVKWVGYPNKKNYTWEPAWRLKADVRQIVKSYERAQRDIRNKQKVTIIPLSTPHAGPLEPNPNRHE